MSTPRDRTGRAVLFGAVALVTLIKIAILLAGPDYDGDAYAHAMAGRRMLLTPGDVTIHWVWLPLLHAIQAIVTLAGGGLSTVRLANALISSAAPVLFFAYLTRRVSNSIDDAHPRPRVRASAPPNSLPSQRRGLRPLHYGLRGARLRSASVERTPSSQWCPSFAKGGDDSVIPWLAAALLALDPLCLWLGVTGQTEPLFQVLLLGVCVAVERRAFVAAGLLFAAAALTRYEAWPLIAAGLWIANRERPIRLRPQAIWILPSAAIAAWVALHARATGELFQFLRYNRDFVQGYLAGVGYPWGKQPIYPLMAVFYVTVVPVWNMLGPVHVLGIAGVRWAIRSPHRVFLVVSAALLAIITGGLLQRSHLGLPRHAVAVAPLFCLLAAAGVEAIADRAALRFKRFSSKSMRRGLALFVVLVVLFSRTVPAAVSLYRATKGAYVEQAEAARALVSVARPGEAIFCEDGKIEVLSALSPDRFVRWQIPDVAPEHVASLAKEKGAALVITTPERAAHLPGGQPLWTNGHLTLWRYSPR